VTAGGDGTNRAQVLSVAREYVDQPDLAGSWFELGGSSLDAARLVSRLSQMGLRVALSDLLDAPSVRDYLTVAAAESGATVESGAEVEAGAADRPSRNASEPASTRAAPTAAIDVLWPALNQLSPRDRIALARRLLDAVLSESGAAE
jgi:hypothetical protein